MMKKILKIILSFMMSLGLFLSSINVSFASANDFEIIKTRLKDFMISQDTFDDGAKVETCYVSKAGDYLDMIQEDGSFDDVDYTMTGSAANGGAWEPYLALDRLQAIAIAYHVQDNELYQSKEVITKLNQAIKHWTIANNGKEPTNKNWWEVQIGIQLRFSRIALMLDGVEGIEEKTMNTLLYKLLEKTPVKKGTGQNNLWFDQNYVYYAIITENGTKYKNSLGSRKMIDLKELVDNYLSYCLVVQKDDNTAEAVQVDNSFYMHGRQFYSNGYGLSMFRDMSYWLYMLNDTQFAFNQSIVDLMADYMLDGTSWTIRNDIMELYLGYRPYDSDIGYKNYASAYILPLERMMEVDSERAEEYQKILNNVKGKSPTNGKNGNYYMWRSAYASHMRNNYGVNIKMDSNQVIGGEWRGSWTGQKDGGQLIYWTSSASSAITVDGNEYINVYPTYDWAHVPGTTTAARIVEDYSNSGRFTNGTEHTIGVSNGKYGATAYDMSKKGTTAKKGYFFFDDEFVALGSGISSSEDVNIHTTLNQSAAKDVNVGGQTVASGTVNQKYTTKWLYNDDIGYVFLDDTDVVISNATQKDNPSLWQQEDKDNAAATFKAYIDHGLKPKNGSYAYIVIPNKDASQTQEYANNIPVTVIANTSQVQAVRHDGLKQTQINFYKAGSLEYKDGCTITVDKPCSIIIDESKDVRQISLAVSDTSANEEVHVKIQADNQSSTTSFVSGALPYAGQTMTLTENSDNRYDASSMIDEHEIEKAFDGDESTYWQSENNENQWISMFTENKKHLSTMDIIWGDNFASDYDVYVSQDGKVYQLLTSITDGNGGIDTVDLNGVYPYIKITFQDSIRSNYQIKEITWQASESLALKKEVEVSSTSTNDPENTKDKAVDGNTGTRWSSLRNKDDNWIIVDLGKYAQIDALSVLWEGACSDDYDIQVSSDKVNWVTVEDGKKTSDDLLDEYNYDEPVYGRYVKIHSHKSTQLKYGISIYEISVYGNYVNEDIVANKNVFSSTIKDFNFPTNVADHKANTSWISKDSGEQWIYVELKGIYEISSMSIDWGNSWATHYEIQISDDAQNWETIQTVTDGKGNSETIDDLKDKKAKYVRLKLNQCSGLAYEIIQWSVYGNLIEADIKENIAFNKSATASSSYNNKYLASKAFDGSFDGTSGSESRWVSNRKSNDEWIYVDLENVYDLTGVKLYWEGACGKEYKIQVSNDTKEWTDIAHVTDGKSGIIEFELENVKARYVKMQGIEPIGQYGYSIWEFEVYGTLYQEPIQPKVNIALNKDSVASNEFVDGKKHFTSSLAFDGKGINEEVDGTPSRWVSLRKKNNEDKDYNNQWIYVDLGANYDISKVVLNWEGDQKLTLDYKILVSDDAKEWKEIESVVNRERGIHEFEYKNVTGRYVKMQGVRVGSDYGYSLWEFEVYGNTILESNSPNENISLNKDSVTSSEYTDSKDGNKTYKSLLAFDGLGINQKVNGQDSRWVSRRDWSDDEWIYVDLGGVSSINKVVLEWEGAGAKEYKIQVSNDAIEWTDVIHVKDTSNGVAALAVDEEIQGNNRIHELTFDTVQARYVKMQGIQVASQYGYSLWEFGVYDTTYQTMLEETYNKYKDLDVSKYTPASVELFTKALNQLVIIGNDTNSTNEDIEKAIEQLETSVKGLVKQVDKTELEDAIILASQEFDTTKYTPESIEKLSSALQKARMILLDGNASKEEVNEAIQALNDVMDGLVKKANKDNLTSIFNEAYQLDQDKYTAESLAKVNTLLKDVEALIDDDNASQDEVDKMYEQLRQAIAQLESKPNDNITPPQTEKPEHTEKPEGNENETNSNQSESDIEISVVPDSKPQNNQTSVNSVAQETQTVKTDDTTSTIPFVIMFMISGVGYYFTKKSSLLKK